MLLCAVVTQQSIAAERNVFGVVMPESIEDLDALAGFVYEDTKANLSFKGWYGAYMYQTKQEYGDPGLGYSLAYATASGEFLSVYVYDSNQSGIPDGTESQVVAEELAQSARGVVAAGQYGPVVEQDAAPLSPHFAQVFHTGTLPNGERLKSYTLLRGQNSHFIKVRATGISAGMDARVSGFLEYLAEDLGL